MSSGERPAPAGRILVGRTRELDLLRSCLQSACDGYGTVCLVSGDAGIGKSRLLAELGAAAGRQGVAVHWGPAWESGGAPAYWPWIQVLRSMLATEAGRAALHSSPHLEPAIAQLVPEILPAGHRKAPGLEPAQARFHLMDAVATLVAAASTHGPNLVVLEDLHAADPDSLALLEFIARQLGSARVLLAGSYREEEMQRPPAGSILRRIRREAVHVRLGLLNRDAVREYVRFVTGTRPLEQTITELYTLTEGHPLYLSEVVELGVARGTFRMTPASLTVVISERAASLPAETRELLDMASVIGRDFTIGALAELAELPVERVEAALEPASDARLIEQVAPGTLRFEHMLVREAFHDSLSPQLRRTLHARRAQRLEEWAGDESEKPWADLAQHLEESGPDSRRAAVYAWRRAPRVR